MMFKKLMVKPLAEESLGVRSMCTYIETPDVKVLLDPGVALAPRRFGLPPHPLEYRALKEARRLITEYARKADVITISHYHFDHHTPSYVNWSSQWCSSETAKLTYENKIVLAKSFRSNINASQRRRGWMFSKTGGSYAKEVLYADGRVFQFGGTTISFSEPVPHGPEGTELGWLIMVSVEVDDERVLFASDVQGPMSDHTADLILKERPSLLIVGGPPLYLSGFRVPEKSIRQGLSNLERLVRVIPTTILGHHLLRDLKWREWCSPVIKSALEKGNSIITASEFIGLPTQLLEARRRLLYDEEPPEDEFIKWTKLPYEKRKLTKPPI